MIETVLMQEIVICREEVKKQSSSGTSGESYYESLPSNELLVDIYDDALEEGY